MLEILSYVIPPANIPLVIVLAAIDDRVTGFQYNSALVVGFSCKGFHTYNTAVLDAGCKRRHRNRCRSVSVAASGTVAVPYWSSVVVITKPLSVYGEQPDINCN